MAKTMRAGVAGVAVGVLGLSAVARASSIATEGFAYSAGALNTDNGGTGSWQGAWTLGTGPTSQLPSVVTPGLESTAGSALLNGEGTSGTNGTSAVIYRQFSPSAITTTDTGQLYVSFLMQRNDQNARTTILSLYGGTPSEPTDEVDIGVIYSQGSEYTVGNDPTSNPTNAFTIGGQGKALVSSNISSTTPVPGTAYLLVAQVNFASGVVNLYVDPGSTLPATPSATTTVTGLNTTGVETLRLFSGGSSAFTAGQIDSSAGTSSEFSQIEIGTTFADVVPEPASIGLLGAGVMALALRTGASIIVRYYCGTAT